MSVQIPETYNMLGVMSGTSLDGIDLAFAKFIKAPKWRFEIVKAETISYSKSWQKRLSEAINLPSAELEALNKEYTHYLAQAIKNFIHVNNMKSLDAVCSHGHTVIHRPQDGLTLQIGNLPELATLTGQRIVCDFRVQDVKLGGEGAPLVPIGDLLLFGDYAACINLGGFANISYDRDGERIAFDICPVNVVLNHYAQQLGLEYDRDGEIAASEKVDDMLRQELGILPFYAQKPPKSLGMEWVKAEVMPILENRTLSPQRKIATFTEHIAEQCARVINLKKPQIRGYDKVLVTGGGAHNKQLMASMACKTDVLLTVPSLEIVEFKEALIFAFLGVLRLRNTVNVLQSVTGASCDHCAGLIYTP